VPGKFGEGRRDGGRRSIVNDKGEERKAIAGKEKKTLACLLGCIVGKRKEGLWKVVQKPTLGRTG